MGAQEDLVPTQRDDPHTIADRGPKPERIRWLPPMVLLINLTVLGLLMEYTFLNLRPDLPTTETAGAQVYHQMIAAVVLLTPTVASLIFLWPSLRWFRRRGGGWRGGAEDDLPSKVAERGVNAPIALAAFSLLSWLLVAALAFDRSVTNLPEVPLGVRMHLVIRPLFAGLIAGGMIFFTAGGLCRTHAWPVVLARTQIAGHPWLWRYRVSHRLFALWLLSNFLPLSIVTLTAFVQLEHVKRSLDRFVPETVRHAIEENPEAAVLAKTTRGVTVLFLDIEGYSRLSEELSRPQLNAVVERYFSLFLTPIRAEGGDINETAGDGLMILFQAESPSEHALAAVRAALTIREQTDLANHDTQGMHPPLRVNMGISSGECDVGTARFGGPAGERWTFTASGPVTNLAARLGDRATKGQILLGPETARRVRGQFQLRGLGPVSLKNIARPVEVWEVVSESPSLGDRTAMVTAGAPPPMDRR